MKQMPNHNTLGSIRVNPNVCTIKSINVKAKSLELHTPTHRSSLLQNYHQEQYLDFSKMIFRAVLLLCVVFQKDTAFGQEGIVYN